MVSIRKEEWHPGLIGDPDHYRNVICQLFVPFTCRCGNEVSIQSFNVAPTFSVKCGRCGLIYMAEVKFRLAKFEEASGRPELWQMINTEVDFKVYNGE